MTMRREPHSEITGAHTQERAGGVQDDIVHIGAAARHQELRRLDGRAETIRRSVARRPTTAHPETGD